MLPAKLFPSLPYCGATKQNAAGIAAQACTSWMKVFGILAFLLTLCPMNPLHAEAKQTASASSAEGLLASTEQMIEHLILQIDRQKDSHPEINQPAESNRPFLSSIPNIKPIDGKITSGYGMRLHPIYKVIKFHSGTDFSAPEGTRVRSTGDGIVTYSGYDRGYGQQVTISHGYGFKTLYAHLSKSLVRQGQRISRGEIIALSGNTGMSTGPHLHYEVQKDNIKVNPAAYFFDDSNPDKFITIQKPSSEENGSNS
ncbi:M23 family metallopeptidase [Chlorobium limicola]|jgi:murein DD-endopeptidase MepM/ murein hydrolase activator NlpD|nr:M23 family metallopeptidase [Chlorobium limicola]